MAEHFLSHYGLRLGKSFCRIHPHVVEYLRSHRWSGNVRELENLIYGAISLFESEELTFNHIGPLLQRYQGRRAASSETPVSDTDGFGISLSEGKNEAERFAIERAINTNEGNLSEVAKTLGISRTSLWRKMKKYELEREDGGLTYRTSVSGI